MESYLRNLLIGIKFRKLKATIVVLDRLSADNKKVFGAEEIKTILKGSFITKDGTMIPFHRILEVRVDGKPMYKKH